MRSTLVLTALAALPLLAPAAAAAPTAGVLDAGVVDLLVPTSGGAYDVRLLAGSSGGQAVMQVLVAPHGQPLQRYGGRLSSSELAIGSNDASLRTRLAGQPLTVHWHTDTGYGRGVEVDLGRTDGDGTDAEGWHAAGRLVDVAVQLGSASCSMTGLLGNAVAYRTGDDSRPLAAVPAFVPSGRCRAFAT
jgi:hypothetical protein